MTTLSELTAGHEAMVYAASVPGMPGYCAMCVDEPEYRKHTRETIKEWFDEGLDITRVTLSEGKDGFIKYLDEKKKNGTTRKLTPDLFEANP